MVCIQCYLPPILFMIYLKLIQPLLKPTFERIMRYFRGPIETKNVDTPGKPQPGSAGINTEKTDGQSSKKND